MRLKPIISYLPSCLLVIAVASTIGARSEVAEIEELRFSDHIRPILSENCFACHGPDADSRKGDLRLDTPEGALGSKVIVPGHAGESEVMKRLLSTDPDERMPPPDSGKVLGRGEIEQLARWIDAGAKWEGHWAFIRPVRRNVSKVLADDPWTRNPIDCFILEKLRSVGLEPNAEADRPTLARRAALDVTGLPPSPGQARTFLDDERKGAHERYVRMLLGLPQAAEHRTRFWLDAARYGDTHGMHMDNYREMWPYRDWVINAFKSNMRFDRFAVEQLAGDLLAQATLDQRIATGFGRCHVTTAEGGSIPEELNVRYMVDRVKTVSTVFMGLTAGCAACHDHKYDPIAQREFYQLGAFFNNTTIPAMDGNQKDTPPVVVLPGPEFADEWKELQGRRARYRERLEGWRSKRSESWDSRLRAVPHPVAAADLVLWLPLTEGEDDLTELPEGALWATDHPAGRRGMRFTASGGFEVPLPRLRTDEPFTVSFWFRTPDKLLDVTVFQQSAKGQGAWRFSCSTRGRLSFSITDAKGKNISGLLPGDNGVKPKAWQHVCLRYSGGQSDGSISMVIDGRIGRLRPDAASFLGATTLPDSPLRIARSLISGGVSDIRIFRRWLSDEEARLLAQEHLIRERVESDLAWSEIEPKDRRVLASHYNHTADEDFHAIRGDLCQTERRYDYIYGRSTTTLVMEERRASPPRAWVLDRGQYDQRREQVAPDVPAVFPPLSKDARRDRLGLARWLVHPDHPLTSRVMVNRLWQSIFGVGLVKTSEDFGVMGERPSHPALLDWLAVEFVESGWDVNHMLELILTSATYRQHSRFTPAKLARDPSNRLLSRGSRVRLDAEVLRDQALAISGLLQRDVGGSSVKPYQPEGLWRVVAIGGSNTGRFSQDSGRALYRRSLYTFWKRTAPPPTMAAFDAPTREECSVRRERTNTPLQALILMNDPQFVEAARCLAERALRVEGKEDERAAWMLREALQRPASASDVTELRAAANDFRRLYRADPLAAVDLIDTGDSEPDPELDPIELAAWTMVGNAVMNRDDFVHKD